MIFGYGVPFIISSRLYYFIKLYGIFGFRVLIGIILTLLVYFTPFFKVKKDISTWYWTLLMIAFVLEQVI